MESKQQITQMQRVGYGLQGVAVDLLCNYFRVKYRHTEDAYQYNVFIEPEVKSKGMSRQVVAKLYEVFGLTEFGRKSYAFDGERILYTIGSLPFNSQEFQVLLDEERRPGRREVAGSSSSLGFEEASRKKRKTMSDRRGFKVRVDFTSRISMRSILAVTQGQQPKEAQDALRVLDVVLREHASSRGYLLVRDSFFHSSLGKVGDIGEGVESWTGYDVSFKPTVSGLALNLDLSTTTMIKPLPVLDFLGEHLRKDPRMFNQGDWMKVKRILKGIRITTTHTALNHKIFGLSPEPAQSLRFSKKIKDQTGTVASIEEVNIVDYYQATYNLRLRDIHLPCLDVGKASRPVYLPLEFCRILPGQRYTKKLTSSQRAKLILESRQPPDMRKNLVKKINFGGTLKEVPHDGRWNLNNKIMRKPAEIKLWAVASFCSFLNQGKVEYLSFSLQECCRAKGMVMADVHSFHIEDRNMQMCPNPTERVEFMLGKMQKSLPGRPDLIFCILPEKTSNLYAPLKRACQAMLGVISQCIVPPAKPNDQYFTNVALKINVKCGGYNSVLNSWIPRVSKIPTIIFGIDVSRGVGDSFGTSIAAVVASTDPHYARYAARVKIQTGRNDIVQGLHDEEKEQGMIWQLLMHFYRVNANLQPQQIIIYRDGVSESQFEHILQEELLAFKKVFHQLSESYNPKVTIIVVQKRHHTRFFPVRGNNNVAPGTVVDRDISRPKDYDFFLCSHFGSNKGTSRPSHYNVIFDENGFSPDDIQQLTNYLCYTYAKCTTAISVVSPVYYAHLAARNSQVCLEGASMETASQSSEASSPAGRPITLQTKALTAHKDIRDKMFFC
eukprot:c22645_g1_i2 orf=439-2946(-)